MYLKNYMRNSSKIAIYSIVFIFASASLSFAETSSDKELRGLQALEDIQFSITRLAERVMPMVVNITPIREITSSEGFKRKGSYTQGSGSGVIVRDDGIIVTNNHVVGEDTREAEVRLSDKTHQIARIIGRDKETDIAVLKIETDRKLPAAKFGDSSALKVGQWVLAVGNPMGLDRTVTFGVISGIGRERLNLSKYENFIQTDAAINPGNSGGPLFNLQGEVIGINTAIIHMAQGIGFSIPADMVSRVVDQLVSKGRVVRGWLGVGIQGLTKELSKQFESKKGKASSLMKSMKTIRRMPQALNPAILFSWWRTSRLILQINSPALLHRWAQEKKPKSSYSETAKK